MSAQGGSFLRDNAAYVHIGVEILVIGGITFWMNKRLTDQDKRISELAEQVKKYEEILTRQGEIITQHQEALESILNIQREIPKQSPPPKKNRQIFQPKEDDLYQPKPRSEIPRKPIRPQEQRRTPNVPKTYEEEEQRIQEFDESELDNELVDEINELGECNLETGECDKKKSPQ